MVIALTRGGQACCSGRAEPTLHAQRAPARPCAPRRQRMAVLAAAASASAAAAVEALLVPDIDHEEEAAFCGAEGELRRECLEAAGVGQVSGVQPSRCLPPPASLQATSCRGRRRQGWMTLAGGATTSTRLAARRAAAAAAGPVL